MYLDYFKFKELPFSLTPNIGFFCQLKGHAEALNTLLFSLRSGEGFIKIVGEVGSGKTLLCRKLLDSIENEFITAYIPNPDLTPIELRRAFAREIGVDPAALYDQHELLTLINNKLMQLHAEEKNVVLLLDEAQALQPESLEALRLLTNLETKTTKLMQVVLFGQPELDEKLNHSNLRQLKQRITFGTLFTKKARNVLFRSSEGIPRVVNILCHKALLVAYGRGETKIDHKIMNVAVQDTNAATTQNKTFLFSAIFGIVLLTILTLLFLKGII